MKVVSILAGFAIFAAPLGASARAAATSVVVDKDYFARSIDIKDDALETVATLDTYPGHKFERNADEVVFLRAFISKATGKVIFQVYGSISYPGDWRTYNRAAYATDAGPVDVDVTEIGHNVTECAYRCLLSETIAFEVPDAAFRRIAAKYAADPDGSWLYKFKAQSGEDWTDSTRLAEMMALIEAVDAYRSAHVPGAGNSPQPSK